MLTLDQDYADQLLSDTLPSFQATCPTTRNLGFGHLFYGFARALRPEHVVVIGSKAGFAPICFAKAMQDNEGYGLQRVDCFETTLRCPGGRPRLDFVDPSYSIMRNDAGHSFGIGTWDEPEKVSSIWRAFGVHDIITHFKMRSSEYLQLPESHDIDLLYVDGDHSYQGIMHDFTQFRARIAPGGLVLAHDVDPDCAETDGYGVLRDMPADLYEWVRVPIYPGLAIMRPRGA
jgi:predicted O-methyltransferase YrrM